MQANKRDDSKPVYAACVLRVTEQALTRVEPGEKLLHVKTNDLVQLNSD